MATREARWATARAWQPDGKLQTLNQQEGHGADVERPPGRAVLALPDREENQQAQTEHEVNPIDRAAEERSDLSAQWIGHSGVSIRPQACQSQQAPAEQGKPVSRQKTRYSHQALHTRSLSETRPAVLTGAA